MSGSEGMTSNYIDQSAGTMRDRRDALKTVRVVTAAPAGAVSLGGISARRCHRYLTEAPPSEDTLVNDLRVQAFGQGADAIRILGFQKVNGIAADCWHVLEGRAEMYSLR